MILSLLLAASLAHAAPGDTTRYVVLLGGRAAGSGAAWTEAGEQRSTYEYNDRGRGPKLETRLRLAPDGTPSWMETTGVDYFKNPVSETFSVENGTARWRNAAGRG
ncbi:MAG TPA: hypothetical protein VFQ39_18720, partial [Longimicrobium sp.]|nr:hypothetical protein [Longimicrobium sp.]